MLIDLHTHSTISDGTLTPKQLVKHANKNGLKIIALTDHDTIDGLEEAIKYGQSIGVRVIPGIEISADFTEYNLHILGYFIDYENPLFHSKLKEITNSRDIRNKIMLSKLSDLGFDISFNDNTNVITRAHFAKAMVEKGYVKSMDEAFSKYLSPGKPGYKARVLPSPKKCIDLIHEFGGLASLAHPTLYGVEMENMDSLIKDLASSGLDAVETIYSLHSDIEQSKLGRIAKKHNLAITGGSDFHGDNKPDIKLGSGIGNLRVTYEILENLEKRLD